MATLHDVAQIAGVSPMTVSRAINNPEIVSPRTRARVLEAIEQLGYVPNVTARALVQGRTEAVALLLSDIRNPYFATIARGVEDVAQRRGYTLILGNSDEQPGRERELLETMVSRQVDGVLVTTSGDNDMRMLSSRGIPLVLIDRKVPGIGADLVTNDSYGGGRMLVEHLVSRGYRSIGFVGGPPGISTLEDRLAGYRDAMRAAGLQPRVRLGRYDEASGHHIVSEMIDTGALPDAIVAANNFVALGAITALRQHGIRVPEDVAIACFGDLEAAAVIDPFLTVVSHPAFEIGQEAMRMLLDRIQGDRSPPRERVMPVELIVRRSTPPRNQNGDGPR